MNGSFKPLEDLSDELIGDDVLVRLTTYNNVMVTAHQAFLAHEALPAIAQTTLSNTDARLEGKRGTDLPNRVSG